ncbi:hypothetical protein IEQ34_026314 [Dendrobium chrysotoxum]|uniref:Uncharacterized protein n=1 Tax=Dendrobium chrysotoxum TaxID=161865 RepID=A0AAV7FLX0_DENCH|nr:hypothetical protein IEQ34_026314 [Dendrobium chrysotoxum]
MGKGIAGNLYLSIYLHLSFFLTDHVFHYPYLPHLPLGCARLLAALPKERGREASEDVLCRNIVLRGYWCTNISFYFVAPLLLSPIARRARSPPRRSPPIRRRSRSPVRRPARSRSRSVSPRRGRAPLRRGRSSSVSRSPSPRKGARKVTRSRSPRRPARGRTVSNSPSSSSASPKGPKP